MNTCPECGKVATDAEAMRSWMWLRRGEEGHWTCSESCLLAHLRKVTMEPPKERWLPTPEDEERMGQ